MNIIHKNSNVPPFVLICGRDCTILNSPDGKALKAKHFFKTCPISMYGVNGMKKRFVVMALDGAQSEFLGLVLCGLLFIGGSLAGSLAAGTLQDTEALRGYVAAFLDGYRSAVRPDFFTALLSTVKYHLAAVFLGFSLLGPLLIPLLAAVRGFFLCFSVTAVLRALGARGIGFTLSLFGIPAVVSIPCFFILSSLAFSFSLYLLRAIRQPGGRAPISPVSGRRLVWGGICFALLLALAAADTALISRLVSYAASQITL